MKLPIYMDHHATTPMDPRVLDAMMPYMKEDFGNATSRSHAFGWKAEAAVELARGQVAALIGASEQEILFTSGATEANNLALKGVAEHYKEKGDHIVTLKIEHKAVLDSCKRLERIRAEWLDELRAMRLSELTSRRVSSREVAELAREHPLDKDEVLGCWLRRALPGARVTYLDVESDGRVSLDRLREAITDRTLMVSVMLANNEIGTIQPVVEIGELCEERGVLFHCDAAQGAGKLPFDVEEAQVDLVSLSAHKMYGPKGVGALYVRKKPRVRLTSQIDGGGQERGMRSGTLNVAGIVGFGKAAELARAEMPEESARVLALRERLRRGLFEQLDLVTLNGSLEHRLPGNLNVSFACVESEALMMAMRDVAVSSGSACASASLESSYVLRACGLDEELASGSIRFGLGRFNTEEEVDYVVRLAVEKVTRLREMSPLYEGLKRSEGRPPGKPPSVQ